jgi:hypothetical protein
MASAATVPYLASRFLLLGKGLSGAIEASVRDAMVDAPSE